MAAKVKQGRRQPLCGAGQFYAVESQCGDGWFLDHESLADSVEEAAEYAEEWHSDEPYRIVLMDCQWRLVTTVYPETKEEPNAQRELFTEPTA
jgi:hypothetical protein